MMSTDNSTGAPCAAYTLRQRRAIAVASLRLRFLRQFDRVTAIELAHCLTELAAAEVTVADTLDLIDALFDAPRIPSSTVGAAYRIASAIVREDQP
jgi:hypothetical protein